MNRPANAMTTLALPAENARIVNRRRSIIGWLVRVSAHRNSARDTAAVASSARISGLVQPSDCPWVRASSRVSSAVPDNAAPRMSNVCPTDRRSSGSTRAAQMMARIPIGRLTRNTPRQVANSVSAPPSTGPSVRPSETLIALIPSARPRSPGPNVRATMAGPIACSMPAPIPWTTRNAISAPGLGAAPHSALATVNTPNPTR